MAKSRESASASSVKKVSTGYDRLDNVLQGGFLSGSAVILSSPASDEVPLLLRNFIRSAPRDEVGLLICRSLSSAQAIVPIQTENVKFLVCEETVPPSGNILVGKSVDNLTELNLQLSEALRAIRPSRVALDILPDVLLRHRVLQTRKWLGDLLAKFRSSEITTLAVINPYMHAREEVEGIIDLFDGSLEIVEANVGGELQKNLRVRWMHGIEVVEKELRLVDLIPESAASASQQPPAGLGSLKEPRWLTPLIDRHDETAKLKEAFQDSLAHKSSVIALEGEAGVGKTRLARELALYAQSVGAIALAGRATEDRLPYGPWVELSREYIAQTPSEPLRKILGVHISEFGRLVPDIAAKLGTIPPSKPLEEEQDRIRLYEAVSQFLISVCKQTPLLLLLDDMQWADQASLNLLEHFARSARNLQVLTVCGYRSEDAGSTTALYKTIMRLNRERLLETISVKSLGKEDVTNIMKHVFSEQQVTGEFSDLIYQRTGGNPFFVEEVLRSLVEDGTIFRTERGWDRKPIHELAVPESVKATLRSRLAKLEPDVLSTLVWAAVVGPEFNFEVLRQVSQIEDDILLQRLETAISAGLVNEIPGQKDVFRFRDNRIRELLLSDLSQSRRIRYHLKIAETMEKVYSKSLERQSELIATHFAEAGDAKRGIKYSIMAGDRSRAVHAYEQAINDYKRALDLLELEGNNDDEKALVLEKLGGCNYFAGQPQSSVKCYKQALSIFEKLHDGKASATVCIGLAAATHRSRGFGAVASREALPILRRGLSFLEGEGEAESFEAASIYSRLAWYLGIVDEYNEANIYADRALATGERTKNFGAVASALYIKGAFLADTGKIDEGLLLLEEAFDVASKQEKYEEALTASLNLAIYTYPRDLAKAREWAVRNIELCSRVNYITFEPRCWAWLLFLDYLKGDWTTAAEEARKTFDMTERLGMRLTPISETFRARLSLGLGDLESAEMELGRVLQDPKISNIVATHLLWGELKIEQGREDEAKEQFETSVNAFRNMEFTTLPLFHIETLLHLTAIYANHGESEKARDMTRWAKWLAEQLKSDAGLAMASQAEARVLAILGDTKAVEAAYRQSLRLWEKTGWPYYRAKCLVEYSRSTFKGSAAEARRRLEEAAEIFRKLGAKRDLEKALAMLAAQT